jgi:hypothetical protein
MEFEDINDSLEAPPFKSQQTTRNYSQESLASPAYYGCQANLYSEAIHQGLSSRWGRYKK